MLKVKIGELWCCGILLIKRRGRQAFRIERGGKYAKEMELCSKIEEEIYEKL